MEIFAKGNWLKMIIALAVLLIVFCTLYWAIILKGSSKNVPASNNQDNSIKENLNQNNDKRPQEESTTSVDSADIKAIKEYYDLLSAGKLKEAYAMRAIKDVSFNEFSNWYKNIEYAKPDNFKDLGNYTYDFVVNYKDRGEDKKNYGLRMTVSGGKLSTVSSKEFKAVEAKFGDYTAFSTVRGDKAYLVIRKGDMEDIIDTGDYSAKAINEGFNQSFSIIKFSPKGNYLLYSIEGYESIETKAYDINNKKKIDNPIFGGSEVGNGVDFVPNERYLYYCHGNGIDEGVPGIVYSIPEFKKVFDVSEQEKRYMESICGYNQEENAIVFTLTDPFDEGKPETKIIKYPLGK